MSQLVPVLVEDDRPTLAPVPVDGSLSFEEIHGELPWHEALRIAMGRGFMDIGQGIKQNALMLTDSDKAKKYTDSVNKEIERFESGVGSEYPITSFLGRTGAQAAPFMLTAPVSVPGAAVLGGLEGSAMFTPEASFQSKAINTGLATIFGMGGQSLVNMFRNMPKPSTDEAADAMRTAVETGIGLRPHNVSDNKTIQFVGDLADTEIVGGQTLRQQGRQAGEMARAAANQFQDAGSFIESAKRRIANDKATQSDLYSVLDDLVQYAPDLDPASIRQLSMDLIERQMDSGLPNTEIVNRLAKVYEAQPKENTFEYWKALRTQVGDRMVQWNQDGISTRDLKAVYGQITQEMENTLDAIPFLNTEAREAFRAANELTSEMMERQTTPAARLVEKKDETKLNNILFGGGTKSDNRLAAQQLFDTLDDAGQEAARHRILKFAMDEATNEKGVFSPTRYARNLQNVEQRASVFFSPQQAKDIKNMANLMAHISDPSQAKSLSQVLTAAMFASTGAGIEFATTGTASGGGAAIGMALSQLLPAGLTRPRSPQAMLEALARHDPGSTAWNLIKNDLLRLAEAKQRDDLLKILGIDILRTPMGIGQRAAGPYSASLGLGAFGTTGLEPTDR